MNPTELREVFAVCKEFSVKKLNFDNLEVEFSDKLTIETKNIPGFTAKEEDSKTPTEDEMLFWSSGVDLDNKAQAPA